MIGDGVAEHVEEGGLEEGVELGEGLAALGPQGVRRIQNPRNPLLLGEGREGDLGSTLQLFGIRDSRGPTRAQVRALSSGSVRLANLTLPGSCIRSFK